MIPIGSDYRLTRTPVVNYLIMAVNVGLFIFGFNGQNIGAINGYLLDPVYPRVYQYFSCMFLHQGLMHLGGNMLFLWVFGNAVNDRFGNVGYLAFYLFGGVLSGVSYIMLSPNAPVLGASGAISAVTGAYMVLFPRVRLTLLVPLGFFLTTFEVSSLVFILFQFVYNMFMSVMGDTFGGGVAYVAHAGGYVVGIGVVAALLAFKVLDRSQFDLLNLIKSSHRRGQYRRMAAQGFDPFNVMGKTGKPGSKRWVKAKTVSSEAPPTASGRELELRKEISAACRTHDMPTASRKYLELIQIADDVVLPQGDQLDVANQLMGTDQHPVAADAYERFIKHYEKYEHIGDIYLMLGLLYCRYLNRFDRAAEVLEKAVNMLTDPSKLTLARADLEKARRGLGEGQ